MITITQMDLFKANKSHFFKIHEAYFLETKQGSMKHIIFIDALFKKKKAYCFNQNNRNERNLVTFITTEHILIYPVQKTY